MHETSYSAEQMAAIRALIPLIVPDASVAERSCQLLGDMDAAELEEMREEEFGVLWVLQEIDAGGFFLFVDWKDTETFVASLQRMAARWGARLDFGVADPMAEEFLQTRSVPELMALTHACLLPQGLTLWNWDTQGDCYSVWISRTADTAALQQLARPLQTRIRPGDQPF